MIADFEIVPPDQPPPPAPPPPPFADLSHRPVDRRPDWSIIPEFIAARISQTVACTDADHLPRVPDAGDTIERDGERLQVMHNGVLVTEGGYYGILCSEIIRCLRGVHEPQEEVAFDAVLRRLADTLPADRPPVMIELGAYWAYYSLWFLHCFPHGRSICLEPDPRNLEVGRRNFAINGRTGTFLNAAIGDGTGATLPFTPDDGSDPIDLPTHDLASLLALLDEPAVDVLLADIQGGEVLLLRRSLNLLRSGKIRFLVISTHDLAITGSATTHQDVLAMLSMAGAHVICEHSVSESASGDGLVVASLNDDDRDLHVDITHGRARDSLFGEWEPRLEDYRRRLRDVTAHVDTMRNELESLEAQTSDMAKRLEKAKDLQAERDRLRFELDRIRGTLPFRIRRKLLALWRRVRSVSGP